MKTIWLAACAAAALLAAAPAALAQTAATATAAAPTDLSKAPRMGTWGFDMSGRDPAKTIAIFRIPGSWEDEGFKILARYGVEYCDRSVSMYEAAGRAVKKMAN